MYTFNELALEAWLTRDSCYLIGWNKKNPCGDPGRDFRCTTRLARPSVFPSRMGR